LAVQSLRANSSSTYLDDHTASSQRNPDQQRGRGRKKPFGAVDDFGGASKVCSQVSLVRMRTNAPCCGHRKNLSRSRGQRPLRPPSTNRRRQAVGILAAERAPVPISTQQTSERRGGCARGRVPSCLKLDPSHLRKMGTWRTLLTHAFCVISFGPRSVCLLAWRLSRRICGRCEAWRTLLTHAFCVPSFGSRGPLRAAASLRRACRAALALPFCVVDLGRWHGAGRFTCGVEQFVGHRITFC